MLTLLLVNPLNLVHSETLLAAAVTTALVLAAVGAAFMRPWQRAARVATSVTAAWLAIVVGGSSTSSSASPMSQIGSSPAPGRPRTVTSW